MDDLNLFQEFEQDSYKEILITKRFRPKIKNEEKALVLKKDADIIADQIDDQLDESELSKDDYIQMVMHYKALCKSYKKQLIESHKTIRELHLTIEHLEKKRKQNKTNIEIVNKLEKDEKNFKLFVEKCSVYCEKINQSCLASTIDDDSACLKEQDSYELKQDMVLKTLQNVLKEKREVKNFVKPFKSLIEYLNPGLEELKTLSDKNSNTSFASINKILKDTLNFVSLNTIDKFNCKCSNFYSFDRQGAKNTKKNIKTCESSSSSITSGVYSISSNSNSSESNRHQPSQEFLLNVLNLFQKLFDVDCYLNVPTKMNDLYYKYGELLNFKKAIQNIFDAKENYSAEKLVCNVQNIYKLLNEQINTNLKELLNSNNLEKVIDKFSMYDEYFPLFYKLLQQIMSALEISRLDQIMPSIRALKILSTPTIC